MKLELPTKKTQERFASQIEMRERKKTINLTFFTIIGVVFLYYLQKLMFKFRIRKIKMWLLPIKRNFRWVTVFFLLGVILGIFLFFNAKLFRTNKTIQNTPSRIVLHASKSVKGILPLPVSNTILSGHISHYSTTGCLGCSKNLTMGNGQPLDDNGYTIAVPCEKILNGEIKYGTRVLVKNLTNGRNQNATITDCGDFSKYNRVADLTIAMEDSLQTKTDVSVIEVVRTN